MSIPVIEWGVGAVRGFEPLSHRTMEADSIEELYRLMGKPAQIGLALSRRVTLLKHLKLPNAPKEQLRQIVQIQLDQMFPVGDDELAFDFLANAKDADGIPVTVFAVRADVLREARAQLNSLGAKVAWIAPASIASLSTDRVPAAIVTEAIPGGLGFDVVKDGALLYSRVAVTPDSPEAMEAEVSRTAASAGVSDAKLFALGGLRTDLASSQLGQSGLEILARKPPELRFELPEQKAADEAQKVGGRRRLAYLLCAAVVVVGALVYMDRDDEQQKINKEVAKWERDNRRLKDLADQLGKRSTALGGGSDVLKQAFQPAQYPTDIIATVNEAAGKELWITGITFERGKNVLVRGTAMNQTAVALFVDALSSSDRMRDVNLQFANDAKIEETQVVNFSLTAHVVGNFPIIEKEAKKK